MSETLECIFILNELYSEAPASLPFTVHLFHPFVNCIGIEDYVSGDLAILVPHLSTVGCINVTVVDDTVVEMDEQFRVGVVYSAGQPGVLLGTPSEASITIINDDGECWGLEDGQVRSRGGGLGRCLSRRQRSGREQRRGSTYRRGGEGLLKVAEIE